MLYTGKAFQKCKLVSDHSVQWHTRQLKRTLEEEDIACQGEENTVTLILPCLIHVTTPAMQEINDGITLTVMVKVTQYLLMVLQSTCNISKHLVIAAQVSTDNSFANAVL